MQLKDMPMGTWGRRPPSPIFLNLQENCSEGSHAARELGAVFSVTFSFLVTIVGQLVKTPPPQQKVSQHITDFLALSPSLKISVKRAFFHESGKWLVSRKVLKLRTNDLSTKEITRSFIVSKAI